MKVDTSFCNQVKSRFRFLQDEFGFDLTREFVSKDIEWVEYRSESVYVRLLLSGPDYEPKLVFGKIVSDGSHYEESFDWVDLGQLECCKTWKWESQPNEPFAGRITQLARLLRDCGKLCLEGDEATYAQMRKTRKELLKQHVYEERVYQAKQKAQLAWDEKRYVDYVDHLRGIVESLTESDRKKIEYATKVLGQAMLGSGLDL